MEVWPHAFEVPGDNLQGASGATLWYVMFVGKRNSAQFPYQVANEYIAGQVGRALCLHVPEGLLCRIGDESVFMSHWVESTHSGQQRAPRPSNEVYAAIESNPWYTHGMLMFDLFVANNDRKLDNVLLDRADRLWLVDQGNALFYRPYTFEGEPQRPGVERLQKVQDDLGRMFDKSHHFIEYLSHRGHIEEWAARIAGLNDAWLWHIIDYLPPEVLGDADKRAVFDFLGQRKGQMAETVEANLELFPQLDQKGY